MELRLQIVDEIDVGVEHHLVDVLDTDSWSRFHIVFEFECGALDNVGSTVNLFCV